MMQSLTAALLLGAMLAPQASTSLPWVFPGDFRERLRMSDLVVLGTVETTSADGVQTVDGTEVTGNDARLRVDRVFRGSVAGEKLRFAWFSLHMVTGGGFVYSGPVLADFRPGRRYLVFLKRARSGSEVSMPVYAIEAELAAVPPLRARCGRSQVLPQ